MKKEKIELERVINSAIGTSLIGCSILLPFLANLRSDSIKLPGIFAAGLYGIYKGTKIIAEINSPDYQPI